MEKYCLAFTCRSFRLSLPGILQNLKRSAWFLCAVLLLLLFLSLPASAALEGILAKDSDGNYHYYCYEELIDSRVNLYLGVPDGLYDDYLNKWPVALLDSINAFVDIDYVINEYVCLILQGQPASIDKITERPEVKKAEVPESFYLVTVENSKIVRYEKQVDPEGGIDVDQGDSDTPGNEDDADQGSDANQKEPGEEYPDPDNEEQAGDKDDSEEAGETKGDTYEIIVSSPKVTLAQAQAWSKQKNAHQRFIDIAPLYWEYGKKTGIRPEVLYAQAAYETGYGHFTGVVPASYNNWAGIKIGSSNGGKAEDHEYFLTPEEGVRGHFNHMSAYVGLQPIGEPHDRYYSVKSISWSGTVKYVEELSGKWAPSTEYHETIVRMIGEMK